jgi:hypothetical protein
MRGLSSALFRGSPERAAVCRSRTRTRTRRMSTNTARALTLMALVSACRPPAVVAPVEAMSACSPPSTQMPLSRPVESLSGDYYLTVVATGGERAGVVSQGSLHLEKTDAEHRAIGRGDGTHPGDTPVQEALFGSSSIDLAKLGVHGATASPRSDNETSPGVRVLHYVDWRFVTLVVGAGGPGWANKENSGVYFDLWTSDKKGFSGHWTDGAGVSPIAEGFFCARRAGRIFR